MNIFSMVLNLKFRAYGSSLFDRNKSAHPKSLTSYWLTNYVVRRSKVELVGYNVWITHILDQEANATDRSWPKSLHWSDVKRLKQSVFGSLFVGVPALVCTKMVQKSVHPSDRLSVCSLLCVDFLTIYDCGQVCHINVWLFRKHLCGMVHTVIFGMRNGWTGLSVWLPACRSVGHPIPSLSS